MRKDRFASLSGGKPKSSFGGQKPKPRHWVRGIIDDEDIVINEKHGFASYKVKLFVLKKDAKETMAEMKENIPPAEYRLAVANWRTVTSDEVRNASFFDKNKMEDFLELSLEGTVDRLFFTEELGEFDRTDLSKFVIPEMLNQDVRFEFYVSCPEPKGNYKPKAWFRATGFEVTNSEKEESRKELKKAEVDLNEELPF